MKAPAPHSGKGALNNGVVRTSVRMSVATVDPSKVNLRSDDPSIARDGDYSFDPSDDSRFRHL